MQMASRCVVESVGFAEQIHVQGGLHVADCVVTATAAADAAAPAAHAVAAASAVVDTAAAAMPFLLPMRAAANAVIPVDADARCRCALLPTLLLLELPLQQLSLQPLLIFLKHVQLSWSVLHRSYAG